MSKLIEKDGKYYQKCEVVMLPTNEKALLSKDSYGRLYFGNYPKNTPLNQHLYILSNDKIKKDDWYFHIYNGRPIKASQNSKQESDYLGCKKIIATTDESLNKWIGTCFSMEEIYEYLPQPSKQFIEKYVEKYNKGNIITKVLVEYEKNCTEPTFGDCSNYSENDYKCDNSCIKLKLNPKDNTINIKKVKDNWSREALETILPKYAAYTLLNATKSDRLNVKDWIEQNL